MNSPLVSVNIINLNRGKFIAEAIESVLNQSFQNWELIIVDDGSTDDSLEIINSYKEKDSRITLIKNEQNLGIAKSRNIALQNSRADFVAILDSDDVWCDKEKLKKQVDEFDSNEKLVLLGTGVIEIDSNGREIRRYLNLSNDKAIRNWILYKNPFAHSSLMFKRDKAVEVGGYDEDLRIGEDYILWLKLGRFGGFGNLPFCMVNYRKYEQNTCLTNKVLALKSNFEIIKKFKKDYPNYFLAFIKRFFRYFVGKIILK